MTLLLLKGVPLGSLTGHRCAQGGECCWVWKRDTSSDEVDGHIASLALAHSLLAETDAERARIAATVCATVDYVVKGGLVYVDPVTGNRTTWGYWDP